MKLYKSIFSVLTVAATATAFTACNEESLFELDGREAFIVGAEGQGGLYVIGKSGTRFDSRMSGDTIYIKVNPLYDATTELDSVVPKFCLSKGASVTPDPSLAQNFAKEGGVTYTVTSENGKATRSYVVTYGPTDAVPFGQGFTYASQTEVVKFPDLGFPGQADNFSQSDPRLYGDVNGYIAFCGHDHVVLVARQYSNPIGAYTADLSQALKVYNYPSLTPAGDLNLGSIKKQDLAVVTSDWNGVMVGIVTPAGATESDIYYWTSPSAAPVLVKHLSYNATLATDGSAYIQVAGDIKGDANITCAARRSAAGEHHHIRLEGGNVVSDNVISSGYDSSDSGGFQMISFMTSENKIKYVVGDNEGGTATNNAVKIYVNDQRGTRGVMPALYPSQWQWWVGTGQSLSRMGAKRPYVSALPINGKVYVMMLNGTGWWWGNCLLNEDLQTVSHAATKESIPVNAGWSFGATGDMYWDAATKTAHWVTWMDRSGIVTCKMTCYE